MPTRNRVKFATATTGTGSVTVGTASSGYQLPAAGGMLNDEMASYVIEDGTAWETGRTIASSTATVLSRDLEESSTGALLNLSGSATMYLAPNAQLINQQTTRGKLFQVAFGTFSN